MLNVRKHRKYFSSGIVSRLSDRQCLSLFSHFVVSYHGCGKSEAAEKEWRVSRVDARVGLEPGPT